jgi:hypothetical protein
VEFADLEPYLAPGSDLIVLVELLSSLNDKERKALSGPVRKAAEYGSGFRSNQSALVLLLLGCATGARQVANGIQRLTFDDDVLPHAVRVLRDRNPAWLAELPNALLDSRDLSWRPRRLIRQLVRTGLVSPPTHPNYHQGLVRGLLAWPDRRSVLQALEEDPGLLDDELWQMLRCEGAGKDLAFTDKWLTEGWSRSGEPKPAPTPERTWRHALVALARDGRIDRDRLLDETLTACLRDWKPSDTGWYVRLHHALEPSLDETEERQHVYLRLLAAEPGTIVGLGQRHLSRLLEAGHLDIPAFVEASRPALGRDDKGPVLTHLKLMERVAGRDKGQSDPIADGVSAALSHPRTDVQERAHTLITKLVPESQRRTEFVAAHSATLAPTMREAIDPGLPPGKQAPQHGTPQPMGVAVASASDAISPVAPVDGPRELADLFGQLIEEAADPVDVERAVEAVVRLARSCPRVGGDVLVKRAKAVLGERYPGPWSGEDVRADLAVLTIVWLTGARPGRGPRGRVTEHRMRAGKFTSITQPDWTLASLTSLRLYEAATAVHGGGALVLSLPSFDTGAIARQDIEARIRSLARTARPLPLDLGIAALRIAPSDRDALDLPTAHRGARSLVSHLKTLGAHRHAWQFVTGPSKGMFRDVYENAATWRDAASKSGSPDDAVAAVLDRHDPLRLLGLEAHDGEYGTRFEQVTALWPLLLPHDAELLAAHAHARLNRGLHKNRNATEPLIDALARTTSRTGPVVCSALGLGLSAKNGDERTRAVDALIDLAQRQILDGKDLGTQLSQLLAANVVTASRIAATLVEANRGSDALADPLLDALQVLLPVLPSRREAHIFVDLTAQLATRLRRTVTLPPEFVELAAGKSKTGLAAACRRVPTTPA